MGRACKNWHAYIFRQTGFILLLGLLIVGCTGNTPTVQSSLLAPTTNVTSNMPDFTHIIVIILENHEFDVVSGSQSMPNFNRYISENTLLTQYYAITHPSLPNYLAMFGGDTFKITTDCSKCFVNAASLPDQVEASGRTWRAYLEDMPKPCYIGDTATFAQRHDPFIYFDPIRLDQTRCKQSIVPLTELDTDLAAGRLPNFVYIMPNTCNSAHDAHINPACGLTNADQWLGGWMDKLLGYLGPRATTEPYLIILTFDEGQDNRSCCGLPKSAGGRVATVLISPQAKSGFQDDTPYTHYSLLKTIETAWGLTYLGHAADANNVLISTPWK